MNIKKRIPKIISLLLSFTVAFGNVIPAYAVENINSDSTTVIDGENISTEERNLEDITVTYKQASSFFVMIPKTIVLDGWKQSTYSVKVSGDIDADQCVYVAPVDGIADTENIDFYMKDQASENAKDDVLATVIHNKFHWNSSEVSEGYKQEDNLVSAPDLTAGAWKGTFQMEIKLETEKEHEHNYVDGKCDCGAIDPNWNDSYDYNLAPANEYSDWQYKLDEENGTIGLMGYNGTAKNVIVYDSYQINGKIYKTKVLGSDAYFNGSYSTAPSYYMFSHEPVETVIFGDNIDFSEMTKSAYMFDNCSNLISVDFGANFDTSNVTDMEDMFYYCQSLSRLDVSNFDTSNVTDMSSMFYYCKVLTDLDLKSFDTSNVTDMGYMFNGCSALKNLDLSSFDTSNVTKMNAMFQNCSALATIYVTEGKWSTSKATTSGMFSGCGTSSVTYK